MTVILTVRYSLVESQSRKEVYSRFIQIGHTSTVSYAFMGSQRLKLASEGALKANIQSFIIDMNALKLP